jgi:serine/threonine protein phosphatase PrpC
MIDSLQNRGPDCEDDYLPPTTHQLQMLARGLVQLALKRKSTDNISVMIVWL